MGRAQMQFRLTNFYKFTGSNSYSYSSGGFVGVNQLTSEKWRKCNFKNIFILFLLIENQGSQGKHQPTRKSRASEEEDAGSVKTQDNEMIILGLFREQRQEELYKDRVNQISEESLGCVSDKNCLKKFENWIMISPLHSRTLVKMHYIFIANKKLKIKGIPR